MYTFERILITTTLFALSCMACSSQPQKEKSESNQSETTAYLEAIEGLTPLREEIQKAEENIRKAIEIHDAHQSAGRTEEIKNPPLALVQEDLFNAREALLKAVEAISPPKGPASEVHASLLQVERKRINASREFATVIKVLHPSRTLNTGEKIDPKHQPLDFWSAFKDFRNRYVMSLEETRGQMSAVLAELKALKP